MFRSFSDLLGKSYHNYTILVARSVDSIYRQVYTTYARCQIQQLVSGGGLSCLRDREREGNGEL